MLDGDRNEDERTAHGRRARLWQVRLRSVVAHTLTDLVARQALDQIGAHEQRAWREL